MFSYYRRRRTYTRNPFSCSITSCITAIIGLVGGIIFLLYSTGAITPEQLINIVIIIAVVGVIIVVLYLVLRYYKPKKATTKSTSSTRTRKTSSAARSRSASRARDDDEEEDESESRRYSKAPARAETTSKFTPREDVLEDAPKKTTSTRKKKASFFDNVDSGSGEETTSTSELPAAETKTCAKCSKESPVDAKFCIDCGNPF